MTFTGPSKPKIKIPEKPKMIEAQDQSPITLTIADNVTALTNTSITIQCPTSGVPTPTVTWTKDGEQIPKGDRYTVQDDGSLLINEASEEDNARYTCSAGSVAGKDSASSTVKIAGKGTLMSFITCLGTISSCVKLTSCRILTRIMYSLIVLSTIFFYISCMVPKL